MVSMKLTNTTVVIFYIMVLLANTSKAGDNERRGRTGQKPPQFTSAKMRAITGVIDSILPQPQNQSDGQSSGANNPPKEDKLSLSKTQVIDGIGAMITETGPGKAYYEKYARYYELDKPLSNRNKGKNEKTPEEQKRDEKEKKRYYGSFSHAESNIKSLYQNYGGDSISDEE